MKRMLILCTLALAVFALIANATESKDELAKLAQREALIANGWNPTGARTGSLDAGGEDCATAAVIPGLPFSDADNSCNYVDDMDVPCPGSGGPGAPDAAYFYTPTADQDVTISLCASTYDTRLSVLDGLGNVVGCNEDFNVPGCGPNGWASQLTCLHLLANVTYCIIIDGYSSSDCGDYGLDMVECAPPEPCLCGQAPNSHCNTVGGPIADLTANDFIINVPAEYHITDVNVCWTGAHTWDSDCEIRLTSPGGTTVILVDNRGGSLDNWDCITVNDEGTDGPVSAGVPPYTNGDFVPDFALSAFDGQNAFGNWTLTFEDQVGGDAGTLLYACLSFEYDYILSVELAGFDAIARDAEVELTWGTASEFNNDRFEITRNGAMVASVQATNNATGSRYSFTDTSLENGRTYSYTLVSVDFNGVREELRTVEATPSRTEAVISEFALLQNYPNPFNPTTQISFDVPAASHVTLTVYNTVGQLVATLVNGNVEAGRHTVGFEASGLTSGVYLYTLEAPGFTATNKMMFMK